jgi:hypothetical protein
VNKEELAQLKQLLQELEAFVCRSGMPRKNLSDIQLVERLVERLDGRIAA